MPTCDQAEIAFDLDEKIYPLEAVQNAIYIFTDRAYVRVERSEPDRLKVVMTVKAGMAPSVPGALKGEFDNELIHQVLRQRISDSNQKIREFIVTKALISAQPSSVVTVSSPATDAGGAPCPDCGGTGRAPPTPPHIESALEKEIDRLLAEIESGDGAADPLGVSVPWEEAFGAKGASPKESAPVKDSAPPPVKAKAPSKGKRK
jgi:His-Xaa-Ser system protein HxsD